MARHVRIIGCNAVMALAMAHDFGAQAELQVMEASHISDVVALERSVAGGWTSGHFESSLKQPHCHAWVLIERGHDARQPQIIAFAVLSVVLDEAHLLNVAVATAHQGQGIGTQLLLVLEQCCHANAVKEWFLEVRASNHNALALYKKNGFALVSLRKNYYPPQTNDNRFASSSLYHAHDTHGQTAASPEAQLSPKAQLMDEREDAWVMKKELLGQ